MRLSDFTEINPYEKLPKGTIAKKISMEQLEPYKKFVSGYSLEAYSGGAKFRNGDTIMARITPCLENGKTAFVSTLDKNEVGFGSTEYIVFRAKDGISNPDFVYYLVISSLVREPAIKSMVGSSGRQRVQQTVIDELEIPNYSLAEQQHIVDILGTLDEKIENNNKIIVELESILSSKYHELVARNTTEIPLSNCIELYTGKLDANAAEENGKYPFFTCGITPEKINTYAFDCEAIIIAGNGNFNVKYYNGKFNAYQRTYVIKANKYFAIILQHYKGKIKEWSSSARGSVIKFLTKSMLIDDTIKISNNYAKNEEYESFSKTIQEKIKNLLETNAKLNQLKQLYLKKFFG